MLGREQQRDILAVGLVALSVFVLLALVPVSLLGERGAAWFQSGNAMGVVGQVVRSVLSAGFGAAAFLLPVLLLLGGLRAGEWIAPDGFLRLTVLSSGLLVLIPPVLHVGGAGPEVAGWLGQNLGGPLEAALGWLGASFLLGVLLVILSIATLGWNPFRSVGRWARRLGEGGRSVLEGSRRRIPALFRGGEGGPGKGAGLRKGGEEPGSGDEGAPEEERRRGTGTAGEPSPDASEDARREVGFREGAVADRFLPDPRGPGDPKGGELPPLDLLTLPGDRDRGTAERELDRLGEVLVEKLQTFNVECEIGGRTTGPVVTQFEVIPAPGVKVNRIANLDADLALAMKAQSIRIVAPIPGKGAVGVEIPNPDPETVYLREILESRAFRSSNAELPLALGRDLRGDPYVADLARMPHLLIAGATGSGKSVCLNTLITSLVYRHTPETLRLLLLDPKMVELSSYVELPHLRHPVITDPREAAGVLKWAVLEMERRYELLNVNGVRSVGEFNRRVRKGLPMRRAEPDGDEGDPDRWVWDDGPLPYVVVVVDELADLIMTVQSEVEKPLTQLAQKARAIGIHLIVATQRPSVNVVTGLIKANFPTRIAFRVASKTDSRTILDQNGADALLGNGDMLFLPPGQSEPVRIQGAFIPTGDTDHLTAWYREQVTRVEEAEEGEGPEWIPREEEDILEAVRVREMEEAAEAALEPDGPEDWDELFRAAGEVCIQQDQGSTSLLQRKLRVGYGRAARIVDQLHNAGVLGPPDGTKPREVLAGLDELEAICEEGRKLREEEKELG